MSEFDHKAFLKHLTRHPGVYRMYDAEGKVLYVGKAKNLRNRVGSYFRASGLNAKTQALVSKIRQIEVTVTSSETEALLLEQTLIKELRPPYNILLRDDKSYPYLFLTAGDYPALEFRRGKRKEAGRYFGPYPSSSAVRDSLNLLQKVFLIRQCDDNFFKHRSRPCLQYQIKRCSAPCVGYISPEAYAEDVRHAIMFLEGKSPDITRELAQRMEQAAEALEFEKAAHYRDQIAQLQRIQEQQYVMGDGGDADVFAIHERPGGVCIHVVYVRGGRVLGSKNYYPKLQVERDAPELLAAFLAQFYLGGTQRELPGEIIVNAELADAALLVDAIRQHYGRAVRLQWRVRGTRARWLRLAEMNAQQSLRAHLASQENMLKRFEALQEELGLDAVPQRLECFDISHSAGEATVASCVVFDQQGPLKSDYRRFNIEDVAAGDDYAAMEQALRRRYTRLKSGDGKMPDILLVDGGKGQLNKAREVLEELQVAGVVLLGVAKGSTRKPGLETLLLETADQALTLPSDSPALHLIQHIRDEAHRFAISGHRARRDKKRRVSALQDIPGVGPARRRELLRRFGGQREISSASVEELAKTPGISKKLAEQIYAAFHND